MKSDQIQLAIKITDFTCSTNEISELLKLNATSSHLKGDKVVPKFNPNEKKVEYIESQHSYWEFKVETETEVWIQKHINNFINKVINVKKDELIELSKHAKIELYISLESMESRDSFHFDVHTMKSLCDIGIELDIEFKLKK